MNTHGRKAHVSKKRRGDDGNCLDAGDCCLAPCDFLSLTSRVVRLSGVQRPWSRDPLTIALASATARLAWRLVRSYQVGVSVPRGRPVCPMSPSCSRYALVALSRHGFLRGGALVVRRLVRCVRSHAGPDRCPAALQA